MGEAAEACFGRGELSGAQLYCLSFRSIGVFRCDKVRLTGRYSVRHLNEYSGRILVTGQVDVV